MKLSEIYEAIQRLQLSNGQLIRSPGGVPESVVQQAEARLGVRFPPSFRWFLSNWGGASIDGEVVNGLIGLPFEDACGPDVVYCTMLDRDQFGLDHALVPLVDNDGDEIFYLDTSEVDANGESPVVQMVSEDPKRKTVYASNFAEFLLKRIDFALAARRDSSL